MTNTDYITIEKSFALAAEIYIKRAELYVSQGQYSYAAGCLKKACLKLSKAEKFKLPIPTDFELIMRPLMNELAKRVAENIIKGNLTAQSLITR
jgi:hypothetical protein